MQAASLPGNADPIALDQPQKRGQTVRFLRDKLASVLRDGAMCRRRSTQLREETKEA